MTSFATLAKLRPSIPAGAPLSLDPTDWAAESFELDKSAVYTFGLETGSKEHPLILPPGYEEKAKRIARQRVALAGYRLAAVLNKSSSIRVRVLYRKIGRRRLQKVRTYCGISSGLSLYK